MKIQDGDRTQQESPFDSAEAQSPTSGEGSSVSLTAELVATVPTDDTPIELLMCRAYCKCGSLAEVARAFGVSYYEVAKHSRTPWWADEEVRFQKEQASALDASLSSALDSAVSALLDRIEQGEIEGVNKDGSLRRKPMSASVLARVVDTTFRTRQLIRNKPTSIAGDTEKMGILAQKLRALGAKDVTILNEAGEVTDVDTD
jgi:hypothetical protein